MKINNSKMITIKTNGLVTKKTVKHILTQLNTKALKKKLKTIHLSEFILV